MHKLSVLLAVICLVQAIQCGPIDDLTPETKQKLSQAIKDAEELKKDDLQKVGSIRGAIGKKIKKALKPIDAKLDDIDDEAKKAKKDAKASGDDIAECLDAVHEATHHFSDDEVAACKKTKETKQALKLVDEIAGQIDLLSKTVSTCSTVVGRNDCVSKAVDEINVKIVSLQKEISSVLGNSQPEAEDKCIADGVAKLDAKLNKAVQDFRACVAAHKSTSTYDLWV